MNGNFYPNPTFPTSGQQNNYSPLVTQEYANDESLNQLTQEQSYIENILRMN